EKYNLSASNIKQVIAYVPSRDGVIVLDRNSPNINFHYLMSIALIDGEISYRSSLSFERMKESEVIDSAKKIKMELSEELQKEMPNRVAEVKVITVQGKVYQKRVD